MTNTNQRTITEIPDMIFIFFKAITPKQVLLHVKQSANIKHNNEKNSQYAII